MAKVLFGLNFVDHPPTHRRGAWRKLVSSQRKKAIMACFRMAPLHSMPRHRAMNIFLRAYRDLWLEAEEDTRARLIEHLCVSLIFVISFFLTFYYEKKTKKSSFAFFRKNIKKSMIRKSQR